MLFLVCLLLHRRRFGPQLLFFQIWGQKRFRWWRLREDAWNRQAARTIGLAFGLATEDCASLNSAAHCSSLSQKDDMLELLEVAIDARKWEFGFAAREECKATTFCVYSDVCWIVMHLSTKRQNTVETSIAAEWEYNNSKDTGPSRSESKWIYSDNTWWLRSIFNTFWYY